MASILPPARQTQRERSVQCRRWPRESRRCSSSLASRRLPSNPPVNPRATGSIRCRGDLRTWPRRCQGKTRRRCSRRIRFGFRPRRRLTCQRFRQIRQLYARPRRQTVPPTYPATVWRPLDRRSPSPSLAFPRPVTALPACRPTWDRRRHRLLQHAQTSSGYRLLDCKSQVSDLRPESFPRH